MYVSHTFDFERWNKQLMRERTKTAAAKTLLLLLFFCYIQTSGHFYLVVPVKIKLVSCVWVHTCVETGACWLESPIFLRHKTTTKEEKIKYSHSVDIFHFSLSMCVHAVLNAKFFRWWSLCVCAVFDIASAHSSFRELFWSPYHRYFFSPIFFCWTHFL